jgi:hypothetical protein
VLKRLHFSGYGLQNKNLVNIQEREKREKQLPCCKQKSINNAINDFHTVDYNGDNFPAGLQ